jgi:hypothetical protein
MLHDSILKLVKIGLRGTGLIYYLIGILGTLAGSFPDTHPLISVRNFLFEVGV